jgi:hypothetical protein
MSEKFLARIINLLNRAQPDGLTFDALTFHLYNSEQDFFGERPDMRSVATALRSILYAYSTHITLDANGAYHLRKGIPQQLTINFEAPQESTEPEIVINEPSEADYGEQLLLNLFEDAEELEEPAPMPPPYSFPTLFDDDPNFI